MGVTPTYHMDNVSRSRKLRKSLTEAEKKLWRLLRKRQVADCKFRRQAPIGPYIVDFVCLERRLVVEVDGGQHTENECYDTARTSWLEEQGFRVIRFWNSDVLDEPDAVLGGIWMAVEASSPPSGPPFNERDDR